MLALTSTAATIGLLAVFAGVFPILVQGILAFIAAQVAAEKQQNDRYRHGRD